MTQQVQSKLVTLVLISMIKVEVVLLKFRADDTSFSDGTKKMGALCSCFGESVRFTVRY